MPVTKLNLSKKNRQPNTLSINGLRQSNGGTQDGVYDNYVEIPIEQGFALKTIVEILRNCVTEADFIAHPDGLFIRGTNDSMSLTVNICLDANRIAGWRLHKEVGVRVNIHFLHLITKNIKKRQHIVLFIREDDTNTFFVGIQNMGNMFQVRASKLDHVLIEDESVYYETKPGLLVPIDSAEYYNTCHEMHNLSKTLLFQRIDSSLSISLRENKIIHKSFVHQGEPLNGLQPFGTNSKIFQFGHVYSFSKMNGLENKIDMYYYDEENACLRLVTQIKNYGTFQAYIRPNNGDELVYELPPGVQPV